MKKIRLSKSFIAILCALGLAIIISFVLLLIDKEILGDALYSVLLEIDKALFITIVIGGVAKLISNDILAVKKNDNRLRSLGIYSIGEGKLSSKQALIMFGGRGHVYPKELRFCFISGVIFLKVFEKQILKAMENGCKIKILLADPNKSKDFLERTEALCPQRNSKGENYPYATQIKETIKNIENMSKIAKELNYPGSIEIRHYIDEYRYAFRLADYWEEGTERNKTRLWANFQPLSKDAIDLSLCVHGILDDNYIENDASGKNPESGIVYNISCTFNEMWEKYKPVD